MNIVIPKSKGHENLTASKTQKHIFGSFCQPFLIRLNCLEGLDSGQVCSFMFWCAKRIRQLFQRIRRERQLKFQRIW